MNDSTGHVTETNRVSDTWTLAQTVLPGGVNAAARLNTALGRPFLVSRGKGAVIVDESGREYVDFNMSHGASLLGYGHPAIASAIKKSLDDGLLCAHETRSQVLLAQELTRLVPSAEMVRFCGTGTETTWHAIRLARAYTGKSKIVKFEGHFHGYNDYLAFSHLPPLDAAGPAESPHPFVDSAGIPEIVSDYVIVLPFNDRPALEAVLRERHHEIAAIILEPVNVNSGTILPLDGYLECLRGLTKEHNIVLIFDEILSGFQTGTGGAQADLGVVPDLTTLGKALGGGMPLSALVGRREIMSCIAPLGKTMHSGTYIAHPSTILPALAFLAEACQPSFYPALLESQHYLTDGLRKIFRSGQMAVKIQAYGSRFSLLFGIPENTPVINYRDVARLDHSLAQQFYALMFEEGVYFNPSIHHGISTAHTRQQLSAVLERADRVIHVMTSG